jgi:hypothetical protein
MTVHQSKITYNLLGFNINLIDYLAGEAPLTIIMSLLKFKLTLNHQNTQF